ncbi:hypothetical protein FB567DRAFT_562690 [Paraphoma chrysanthemicola]|uniref:Ricin B lectin domain-containing protein n=1 Tax=Paraphoma chrysanthemicola TaxID=798071 RepID=A0A8K0VV85_9PLEO|nr:hypothetical protein FB567DRAFT_562690 [Paraphoma chrysanthemicola]
MLFTFFAAFALAATGLAQVAIPEGYRKVYITSKQDTKFVIVPKTRAKESTLVVSNSPTQTLCMDAGPKSAWKDMANIYLRECNPTEVAQKWVAMADGRIALEASPGTQQCVDLQYLRATQNNPVGLYNCAGLGNTGAADKGINWPLQNVTTALMFAA